MPKQAPDYSAYKEPPGSTILGQLREAAQKLITQRAVVAKLEDELKAATDRLTLMEEKIIPDLMEKADSLKITTADGLMIEVKEQVFTSIKEENKPKAFAWLEKNKLGDIIKRQFVIKFGKGDEAWAKKFQRDLLKRKKPLNSEVSRNIHPGTLKKTVTDILEEGKLNLPLEVFGVHRRKVAEVSIPEKKEGKKCPA